MTASPTHNVFRDDANRYTVREVFYEQDGKIIGYGKSLVALVGESPEEILQMITWFREAFDLPILSMDAIETEIAAQPTNHAQHPPLSFQEVRTMLSTVPSTDIE